MFDAEQGRNNAVPPGLCLYSMACVDEDDGQITGGGAGCHVSGVLLVPGGVGDDKFASCGGKIAIGDVDSNALFPFRLQAIDQQGQVYLGSRRA